MRPWVICCFVGSIGPFYDRNIFLNFGEELALRGDGL
jgi:hypothetical protein